MEYKYKFSKIDKLAKKVKAINLLGGKCSNCNEDSIFKLSFHHFNESEKKFKINEIKGHRWSKIEEELKKCILLCNNCHMEHHHKTNEENRHQKNKKLYLEVKGIFCCEDCGYNKCKSALHFHHIDDKKFKLSDLNKSLKSILDIENYIIDEINKCKILCSNCHTLEHSDVDFFEKFKKEILEKSKKIKEVMPKINRNEVYRLYFVEKIKKVEISKIFNCSKSTISKIIKDFEVEDSSKLS